MSAQHQVVPYLEEDYPHQARRHKALSEVLSIDASVDEDFIPTSQPHSDVGSKLSKNSETSLFKSTPKESVVTSSTEIDNTLPTDSTMERSLEKSEDFIPETETKRRKMELVKEEPSCKKNLSVFNNTEDIFETPIVSHYNLEDSKILENPPRKTEGINVTQDSFPEILVNDSTETVDLEATDNSDPKEMKRGVDSVSCSFGSEVSRSEETQIFDNSSILLLDQKEKEVVNSLSSQKLYLEETVEDQLSPFEDKINGCASGRTPPPTGKSPKEFSLTGELSKSVAQEIIPSGRPLFKPGVSNSTTKTHPEVDDNSVIETREIDLKLSLTCLVTFNAKTKKVMQKLIMNVNEIPNVKPKPPFTVEQVYENGSDKSKRYSTSSSGSVYSDKTGLPFALPKRVSAGSDATDSSEDSYSKQFLLGKKVHERLPWSNEYLVPLKLDEIVKIAMENPEFYNRPPPKSSRAKGRTHCGTTTQLEEIRESFTSERSSAKNGEVGKLNASSLEDVSEKERMQSPTLAKIPKVAEVVTSKEALESVAEVVTSKEVVEDVAEVVANGNALEDVANGKEAEEDQDISEIERRESTEEEDSVEEFRDGLQVFARWTDKRYYSGVINGVSKNDRWEVSFDDGTTKTIREEFIIPAKCLKAGALVFALHEEGYESGQIVDVRRGNEVTYVVELDGEKNQVLVKRPDLRLTDVMASIIKENFKPFQTTPKGKSFSDIDFDNVLTGKRLREQRTPLRPLVQIGNSGGKKKSFSKGKKTAGESASEPREGTTRKGGGLKSDNGHLVEDKVISADSPSGNETGDTPLRGSSKVTRGKAKPRNLSYETEEVSQRKAKAKYSDKWISSDGTPIPGPSGVKFKKPKGKLPPEDGAPDQSEESETPGKRTKKSNLPSEEKKKRKRKLDESAGGGIEKSNKETEAVRKMRKRKG